MATSADWIGPATPPAQAPVDVGCYIKQLPERLGFTACQTARDIFPANAPGNRALPDGVMSPQNIALLTTKYWGPTPRTLTVSFLEPNLAPYNLQTRILSHMNAWKCSITFQLAPPGQVGDVRISLTGSGFWSYLGTDIMHIPNNQPTMNLQNFSMSTPESEYKRVVRHETGHTLGFPHEHLRKEIVDNIDRNKAYNYFAVYDGWSPQMVDSNVLVPIDQGSIMGTPVDVVSIMCYQLPGTIMKNGQPVPGGLDIDQSDFNFCQQIYPSPSRAQQTPCTSAAPKTLVAEDWGPEQDVDISARKRRFIAVAA